LLKDARPPLSVTVVELALSIVNVTVPVGTPAPGGAALTTAVKTIGCPNTAGFAEELTSVCDDDLLTVWLKAAVVLAALKLLSPLYEAVIEWLPRERLETVNVAV